ncbi:MAG: class B sortase, partial [Bacilli bacterium]|nr:class B sortase [Bacilli bacterium]
IKLLANHNKANIKVVIHENINDEKTINYLKDLNKNYKKKKVYLSLEYSKEYLDKNILQQTIVVLLKVCGLIISSLVVLVITYIGIFNYVSLKEVNSIKEDLANAVDTADPNEVQEMVDKKNNENEANLGIDTPEPDEPDTPPEEETPTTPMKYITNMDLASLLAVNEEVIGELKVKNTNVDYPVVQGNDNDYYLKHNINKEKNQNGWIYLDYRNNAMHLDKNNIIYGHNMYYSGVMFGTLHKTTNKSWYTNKENQIITYNTLYDNMHFQIFSIYRVPKTSDYLKVFFKDDADFLEFASMITKRSIYNFNVPIKPDDKILTLSTCSDNGNKRLVVHAVLINEETSTE